MRALPPPACADLWSKRHSWEVGVFPRLTWGLRMARPILLTGTSYALPHPLQGPSSVLKLKAGRLGSTQQTSQSAPSFHWTRGSPPPPTQPEGRESGGIRHQSKINKTVEEDLQQVDKGSKQVATYSIPPRNPQALPTPALDLAFLLEHLRD